MSYILSKAKAPQGADPGTSYFKNVSEQHQMKAIESAHTAGFTYLDDRRGELMMALGHRIIRDNKGVIKSVMANSDNGVLAPNSHYF